MNDTDEINITWSAKRGSLSLVELAIIAGIVLLVGYLLLVAVWLRIDYFDSYENFLNARSIIHGDPSQYSIERALLLPVLLTPVFLVFERVGSSFAEFVAAHLLAVMLFSLFLFTCYRLFRVYLTRLWALAGLLALSWNVLLISQAPLAKEDIPGALFATAAFFFYLRARQTARWRDFVLAGVSIGGVMGTRYQLAPLPFAVILLHELLKFPSARWGWLGRWHSPSALQTLALRAACLVVLPVVIFLLLPILVYPLAHKASVLSAPQLFVQDLKSLFTSVQAQMVRDPAIVNYRFLAEAVTWPLLLCAALGVVTSVRSRQPATRFHLLWFGIFFVAQTYLVAHKEARYLIGVLPPLYFFVARGFQAVSTLPVVLPRIRLVRQSQAALIVGLVLLLPAANAVAAGVRYTDPAYTTDYEAQVARYASVVAGSGRVFWVGPYYPVHPHDYVFDPADPFTYVYDYYATQTTFWTREWVFPLFGYRLVATPGGQAFVYPGVANVLRDGDVIVVNPLPVGHETGNMPASVAPLVVEQVHTQVLTSGKAPDGSWIFASPTMPGAIRVHEVSGTYLVEGSGLPDGIYELYAPEINSTLLRSLAVTVVNGGSARDDLPAANWPAGSPGQQLVLLYYGSALSFPPPGS